MPRLCKYENCRLRATGEYCGIHKSASASASASASICTHNNANLYKGYCRNCYISKFPDDPMSFQMRFKDKVMATHEFIDNRFDGFSPFQETSNKGIKINDTWLIISCDTGKMPDNLPGKYISVQFNTDKYKCSKTGKTVNPMLYRRLPLLEDSINRQIERILHVSIEACADLDPEFIKINCHL
jgi:hypothetical protein